MSKTVIITGTSSGIGKQTTLYFSEEGWNVIATMRNPEKRTTGFEEKKNIEVLHLDVLDITSIQKTIDHAIKNYGRRSMHS
jgi:NAD(P)-dependent dehydrogenase (short-subunit alcohol dehydrogenase family)